MTDGISLLFCPVTETCETALPELMTHLTDAEIDRANRFICHQARQLFVVSHVALHQLLRQAGLTGCRFGCSAEGKPFLIDYPQLHFNLSHTEGLIMVALAKGSPIGVDVEIIAERRTYSEIVSRVMTPSEHAYMAAQPNPEDRFTQLWCAKEAVMKATGLGFGLPPLNIELQNPEPTLTKLPPQHGSPADWQLWCERLPEHWFAVAARQTSAEAGLSLRRQWLKPQDLLHP